MCLKQVTQGTAFKSVCRVSQEVRGGDKEKALLTAEVQMESSVAAHFHRQAPWGSGRWFQKSQWSVVHISSWCLQNRTSSVQSDLV